MVGTRGHNLVFLSVFAALGCGDDATSAEGSGSSASSTTDGANASTGEGGNSSTAASDSASSGGTTDASSSGTTVGVASSTGSSTGEPATSAGTTDAGTTGGTASTEETGDETGGTATVCADGGEFVLQWGLQVPGGIFPDDVPEDLTATCSFTPSVAAGEIPFTCNGVDFLVTVESTPVAALPDTAQSVEVRLHRQIGPLGFPDFWVDLEFADGQRFSFINSSVLVPNNNTVELPYGMVLSEEDCGPYNIGNPFQPEDPCGEQMWHGLRLDLDTDVTVFHGAHAEGASSGVDVGFWVATARDYGVLPKTCDFAARFYSAMVVTAAE
ncbi:MAG: hypothetical protein ACRBN8_44060 [Nannocystales bacterium]